ncbi:selenoprotein W-like [Paroedura picta]|uniref:selenoprotein W-like n=1 Tax=Paroedura picta TaxID=143630 RepID=UPI004055A646
MQLKQLLEKCFPNQLDISGDIAPERGSFEVILLETGELLHSKQNGDGYVDSNEKVKRICSGIRMKLRPPKTTSDQKQPAGGFSKTPETKP